MEISKPPNQKVFVKKPAMSKSKTTVQYETTYEVIVDGLSSPRTFHKKEQAEKHARSIKKKHPECSVHVEASP
jgi:hypothetical protein